MTRLRFCVHALELSSYGLLAAASLGCWLDHLVLRPELTEPQAFWRYLPLLGLLAAIATCAVTLEVLTRKIGRSDGND